MSPEKNKGNTEKKIKTTFYIDADLWKQFQLFVINKKGSARKLSETLEEAIREYLKRHSS